MKPTRGKVTSDKMVQTAVVEVTRLVSHPMYHKRMRKTKKFHAHNEVGAKTGNVVEMIVCKRLSSTNHRILTKLVS